MKKKSLRLVTASLFLIFLFADILLVREIWRPAEKLEVDAVQTTSTSIVATIKAGTEPTTEPDITTATTEAGTEAATEPTTEAVSKPSYEDFEFTTVQAVVEDENGSFVFKGFCAVSKYCNSTRTCPVEGRTVAISELLSRFWNLPKGSRLWVEGHGEYVVEEIRDDMNGLKMALFDPEAAGETPVDAEWLRVYRIDVG